MSRTRKNLARLDVQVLEERSLLSIGPMSHGVEAQPSAVVTTLAVSHQHALVHHAGGGMQHRHKLRLKGPNGGGTGQTGVVNGPIILHAWTPLSVAPDLRVESLTVKDLGGGNYAYDAIVRNGDPSMLGIYIYQDYAGGGRVVLSRSSGEMVPAQPDANGDPLLFLAALDPGTQLAAGEIPRLSSEQTFELKGTTTGRGVYTVAAVRDQPEDPLPISNPKYASKTVDNLQAQTFDYTAAELNIILAGTIGGANLRLDSNDSEFKIPALFDTHFQIPGKDVQYDPGFGLPKITETYYVNDIESTGVTATYSNGALVLNFTFADNSHALHTPTILLPDVSVSNMSMTVTLPLVYDPTYQYIHYTNPSVVVNAKWSFNGPIGWLFSPGDYSSKFQDLVTNYLNDPHYQEQIEYAITHEFHQLYAGGHMTGATFGQSEIFVSAETP
jgi:hypothetical protein